jgi:hypothetical protein
VTAGGRASGAVCAAIPTFGTDGCEIVDVGGGGFAGFNDAVCWVGPSVEGGRDGFVDTVDDFGAESTRFRDAATVRCSVVTKADGLASSSDVLTRASFGRRSKVTWSLPSPFDLDVDDELTRTVVSFAVETSAETGSDGCWLVVADRRVV